MEQNSNPAILADVTTSLSKEESVLVMERRPMFTLAVLKDAQTFMSEEGSVLGMERSAKRKGFVGSVQLLIAPRGASRKGFALGMVQS